MATKKRATFGRWQAQESFARLGRKSAPNVKSRVVRTTVTATDTPPQSTQWILRWGSGSSRGKSQTCCSSTWE